QHRAGVQRTLTDGQRPGDLERHVVGVHLMELAVYERDLHVDHRVTGDHPFGHVVDDALLHRDAEVLRYRTAEDLVLPDKSLAPFGGGYFDDADPVLPVAA